MSLRNAAEVPQVWFARGSGQLNFHGASPKRQWEKAYVAFFFHEDDLQNKNGSLKSKSSKGIDRYFFFFFSLFWISGRICHWIKNILRDSYIWFQWFHVFFRMKKKDWKKILLSVLQPWNFRGRTRKKRL